MLALVQEHAGNSPATANGIFMMIAFMARSAIVVVVGFIGHLIGLQAAYLLSAVFGLLAIPLVLKLPDN
jgi:FSR family fosmidomycin resistance protein-like MFS transporter